jgi:hypothetical protein
MKSQSADAREHDFQYWSFQDLLDADSKPRFFAEMCPPEEPTFPLKEISP